MNVEKQIKKAKKIINYSSLKIFNNIYDFTTENFDSYMNEFNLENSNLFTVGSSGDQVLNAINRGCLDITLADINPFSLHYLNLKIALVKVLAKEEFESFLICEVPDSTNNFFRKKIYNKIRSKLSDINKDSRYFWDSLYDNFTDYIIGYILFQNYDSYEDIKEFNTYLKNDTEYNNLKYMLDDANIKFINKNVFDIKDYEIDKQYDNILLYNIYDYNNKLFRLKKFKCALNRYIDLLSSDGKLLITYLHDIKRDNKLERFERKNLVDNYYLKNIENKSGRCDRAVIYQKKKN